MHGTAVGSLLAPRQLEWHGSSGDGVAAQLDGMHLHTTRNAGSSIPSTHHLAKVDEVDVHGLLQSIWRKLDDRYCG